MGGYTWSITLSCGDSYRLLSGTPDLKTPYLCGVCDTLRFVTMAVRNEDDATGETT